jgi:hypothetical protein
VKKKRLRHKRLLMVHEHIFVASFLVCKKRSLKKVKMSQEFGMGSNVIKYTFQCGGIVYLRVTEDTKLRYQTGKKNL